MSFETNLETKYTVSRTQKLRTPSAQVIRYIKKTIERVSDNEINFEIENLIPQVYRARICKTLRNPGIDSK